MLHISRPFLATVVSSCMKLFSQLDNTQLATEEKERKGENVRRRRRRGARGVVVNKKTRAGPSPAGDQGVKPGAGKLPL